MTAVLARPLTVNDRYVHRAGDLLQAIYLPGGCWSVKVRRVGDVWLGFAVPRGETTGAPFVLVSGPDKAAVHTVTLRWANSALTLGGNSNRVRFAGYASALDEQPYDVETLAVAL